MDCCTVHPTNAKITSLSQMEPTVRCFVFCHCLAWLTVSLVDGSIPQRRCVERVLIEYLFYPVALVLGIKCNTDLFKVSELIDLKVIANEFAM